MRYAFNGSVIDNHYKILLNTHEKKATGIQQLTMKNGHYK